MTGELFAVGEMASFTCSYPDAQMMCDTGHDGGTYAALAFLLLTIAVRVLTGSGMTFAELFHWVRNRTWGFMDLRPDNILA